MNTTSELNLKFNNLNLSQSLQNLRAHFNGRIVFSTSLGLEDQAITDAIFRNDLDIEVFTLDTGRNFQETYTTLDETRKKYGKPITAYYPRTEAVEAYVSEQGINAMYDSVEQRKQCCHIRKIEPLNRTLAGIAAGEDERAGRWWWEQEGAQECGLHFTGDKIIRRAA